MTPLNEKEKDCVRNEIRNNPIMTDKEIAVKCNVPLMVVKRIRSRLKTVASKLPEPDRAQIRALLKDGLTPEEISCRHGYPLEHVERIAKRIARYLPNILYRTNENTRQVTRVESSFMQPPNYVKNQVCPLIESNDMRSMEKEIMWTYLVKLKYEKNVSTLVKKLCFHEETLPENPQIGIETPLYPDETCRADMAVGFIEEVPGSSNQIRSNGEWFCIAESKWYDDVHPNPNFPEINQLCQKIEHAILVPKKDGTFPKRVYVTLITPDCFRNPSNANNPIFRREYQHIFKTYKEDKTVLKEALLKYNSEFLLCNTGTLIDRIAALEGLNWITFEELLGGIPNLVDKDILRTPDPFRVTRKTWKEVFAEVELEERFSELIEFCRN